MNSFIYVGMKSRYFWHQFSDTFKQQGYDNTMAELMDKTWNDRMDQFMKRTKSKNSTPK